MNYKKRIIIYNLLGNCFYYSGFLAIYNLIRKYSKKKYLSILMYHKIQENIDSHLVNATPTQFESQLNYLKKHYKIISFNELNNFKKDSVIITFDDGYLNNYNVAFPILKKYNSKATIFLTTSLVNKDDFLTKKLINQMNNYEIEFESHTLTHPDLTKITPQELDKELSLPIRYLKTLTKKDSKILCYPYGLYNQKVVNSAIEKGYKYAVTIDFGLNTLKTDKYRLRRIMMNPEENLSFFKLKLTPLWSSLRKLYHFGNEKDD